LAKTEESEASKHMSSNEERFLIVAGIPAFNEEKTIAKVVLAAEKEVDIVIVCDDGSSDFTAEIAERLGAVVIHHEKNMGYGAALQSLFARARQLHADVLVTVDSDGQHDPAQIPLLVKPIEAGIADVVLGSRFKDSKGTDDMPAYRQFGIQMITKLTNGNGKNGISDAQSGFRAYGKKALQELGGFSENGMSASIEIIRVINKNDLKICEVPISCKYFSTGVKTSTKNPLSHGVGLLMALVKLVVEDRPLAYLGIPGIFSTIIGVFFGVWMLNIYANTHAIVTNIALSSITFILIGFFLIMTAVTLYAIIRVSKKIK
jgi:glycosyltransferase involved in cell wall biosynthesis